ncbi:MAG: hypothetical protein H6624_09465 [Bdellovibrionaceae bacterium]|nr:hypothetical protein [Bdellovibrionales bacterium]MCB9084563.1 hypothetical protein [Pseudobdellovibrionaceae bacterium]
MNKVPSPVDQIYRRFDRFLRSLLGCGPLALVLILVVGLSISVTSLAAGSANSRRGDYVIGDGGSSIYGGQFTPAVLRWTEPVDGYHPEGCDNSPGLAKNLKQFGQVIPAAIMGRDSRCPLPYDRTATDVDKMFYGVGAMFYDGRDGACKTNVGAPCQSTAHLILDGDMVISTAHTFRDSKSGRRMSDAEIRKFTFTTKVWVPEEFRKDPRIPYEFRYYEIDDYEFGTNDEEREPNKDYVFLKLKERVGQRVGPLDSNWREIRSQRIEVPESRLSQPLPFKRVDRSKLPNVVMTVGFSNDKGVEVQKNCEPFGLYDPSSNHPGARYPGLLPHDGDTLGVSSGSSLSMLVGDRPHFVALHRGTYGDGVRFPERGDFNINRRFNEAIDGNTFYNHFMEFRRKWGRN